MIINSKLTDFSEDIFEDVVWLEYGDKWLDGEDAALQVLLALEQEADGDELLGGDVMDVVHQVLDQLEILLLHRAGLPRNLLRSLAECVLVLDTG